MTTLSALGRPYPHGTVMWHRGQSEDHLYGFATAEGRDAFERGEPGPFERVLRPINAPPPSDEVMLIRALCSGRPGAVQDTVEHLAARGQASDTNH